MSRSTRSATGHSRTHRVPYVYLDATYVKARDTDFHQVVSRAVVIATGITADRDREVLGLAVGDSEEESFWTEFLRSLRRRGLTGVRLVIPDAHEGLKAVIDNESASSVTDRPRPTPLDRSTGMLWTAVVPITRQVIVGPLYQFSVGDRSARQLCRVSTQHRRGSQTPATGDPGPA
jgi:hypothetical protein